MAATSFVLGDHTFNAEEGRQRFSFRRRSPRQILGAIPPTLFDGIARDSTKASPAAGNLLRGKFCGHNEPVMTVFDLVIDGVDRFEIAAIMFGEEPDDEQNIPLVAIRPPDGTWRAIFRRSWQDERATLEGVNDPALTGEEIAQIDEEDVIVGPVSIGFEYPSDAASRDTVSWMTIDTTMEGEPEPICIVDAAMA